MQNSMKPIEAAIGKQPARSLSRAELWLGTELLGRAGMADTVDNHLRLAGRLGHGMVCLPVAGDISDKPPLGYRYFEIQELKAAVRSGNRPIAAVVDGPFQSLVNRMGLMAVLLAWSRDRTGLMAAFESEQADCLDLIRRSVDQGARVVVMADDFAADRGPMISPADVDALCGPFYSRVVPLIQGAAAAAFLHSCGNITSLVPLIKAWRFDGLAAVQHGANDLTFLHRAFDGHMTIMAGIEPDLLASDTPPRSALKNFEHVVKTLAPSGDLILCSSTGLYSGDFLARVRKVYRLADDLAAA